MKRSCRIKDLFGMEVFVFSYVRTDVQCKIPFALPTDSRPTVSLHHWGSTITANRWLLWGEFDIEGPAPCKRTSQRFHATEVQKSG